MFFSQSLHFMGNWAFRGKWKATCYFEGKIMPQRANFPLREKLTQLSLGVIILANFCLKRCLGYVCNRCLRTPFPLTAFKNAPNRKFVQNLSRGCFWGFQSGGLEFVKILSKFCPKITIFQILQIFRVGFWQNRLLADFYFWAA